MAAYGTAGKMDIKILAPASTSAEKIAQVRAHGGAVELIEGSRTDVEDAAIRQGNQDRFYASHNWQAFFLQGTKTLAYELWEDFDFTAPDNVVVPVVAGSSVLGCWLGFQELYNADAISQLPRLFAPNR